MIVFSSKFLVAFDVKLPYVKRSEVIVSGKHYNFQLFTIMDRKEWEELSTVLGEILL